MIGPAMDRGGLQHSKNAPNSIFSKINRTGFWRFGTDMVDEVNSRIIWTFYILKHNEQNKNMLWSKISYLKLRRFQDCGFFGHPTTWEVAGETLQCKSEETRRLVAWKSEDSVLWLLSTILLPQPGGISYSSSVSIPSRSPTRVFTSLWGELMRCDS